MESDRPTTPPVIRVPSSDAAAHLLLALSVTEIVLGRSRAPGVELWLADFRSALTAVLSKQAADAVVTRCQDLERELGRAA